MLDLKRTSLFFLSTLLSTAYAGSMGSLKCDTTLTSRCVQDSWEFGAQALFLNAGPAGGGQELGFQTFNNYSGADNFQVITSTNGAPNTINVIRNPWRWGFQIEATRQYRTSGDIHLDWHHLNGSTSMVFPNYSLYAGNVDGLYGGPIKFATQWNAVNLEFGKKFTLHQQKDIRVHAGVAFAGIENTFNNSPRLLPTASPYFTSTDKLSFNGFGPRLGIDLFYHVRESLTAYAKAGTALFVGETKQRSSGYRNFDSPIYGPVFLGAGNKVQSNFGQVIPEIEGKLGFQYQHNYKDNQQLTFDIGYMWMDYIQAVKMANGLGIAISPTFDTGPNPTANDSASYVVSGLYFGMRWAFS